MKAEAFFRCYKAAVEAAGDIRTSPCRDITERAHRDRNAIKHGDEFGARVVSDAWVLIRGAQSLGGATR